MLLGKHATILNEASSYLYTLGNDIYTGKNSSTNIYLFRVNNSNTRKRREICSKLAIMSLQRRSTVFIVNFEYISYLFTPFSSVFTVGFEQLNVCWVPLYQFINVGIKDFFNECDQIRSFLRIWSHLLKKALMENFIFCAVGKRVKSTNSILLIQTCNDPQYLL